MHLSIETPTPPPPPLDRWIVLTNKEMFDVNSLPDLTISEQIPIENS